MTTPGRTPRNIPEFTIGDRLRKARELAGLEQGQLGEIIDVSRQTIGNYERGDTPRPKKLVVKQWALATGVSFDWLWTGTDTTTGASPTTQQENFRADQHERRERPAA